MEDTIVVARPADMMQPSASSASKSKDGKGGSASQAGTHLDDALGSEDELSLPFDGRQRSKQPNNTVVAIAGSDGADSKMGSSERERQSLLSQFTADKRTAKDVQVKRESDAGPEARPKRQQKPRKFAESL